MSWDRWWLFVATVLVVCGTPGPNMLHVMARSVRFGFARSIWAMAGCMTAVLLALAASALGVGALLIAWPRVFDALRYAGAAYLIYLGVRAWRSGARQVEGTDPAIPVPHGLPPLALYRAALLTGLANPKLILFATALFPQFIGRGSAWGPQFAILVATFVVVETGWYVAYAAGGHRLARWLDDGRRQRLFDRTTGALFCLFGLGLVAARA